MMLEKIMKVIVYGLIFGACISTCHSAESTDWSWQNANSPRDVVETFRQVESLNERYFSVDLQKAQHDLMQVASNGKAETIILPTLTGDYVRFKVTHDSIMAAPLQAKYPSIRSFSGHEVGKPSNTGRFDIGPNGLHGFYYINGQQLYLDPANNGKVKLYRKTKKQQAWQDRVLKPELGALAKQKSVARGPLISNGGNVDFVTYRLAVTTSDEYTRFFNGKVGAMNGIVTTINRVNQIFKTDLAVKLELIANNDALIFEANDPYDNGNEDDTLGIVQTQIDTIIGNENYDVGHLMATSGAGLAGLGVVCAQGVKAWGMTGISTPQGDAYDVDYVAHEIGHQFGANHTYNGSSGACNTRVNSAAYEPGSGVTIMGYAGICGDDNLAQNSIAMFHSHSIDEMNTHLTSGSGSTCGTPENIGNNAPIADAKLNHTIPINTPFVLTGTATDQNSANSLSYAWEQMDLGAETAGAAEMIDNGEGPLFRPYLPAQGATRYLPRLGDVLAGTTVKGEAYPTTNRTMNFRLVVRDGEGGVNYDAMTVTSTTSAGPFSITSPTSSTVLNSSSSLEVTWQVANTDKAPVSCLSVDIMQSSSDGSFDQILLANTANDGSQTVNVAGSADNKARVMVKCSDNIFYAVSDEFQLGSVIAITGQQSINMNEDTSLVISPDMFTVVNQQAGASLSTVILAGDNYSINGETITPKGNYFGELNVPVSINDGSNTSAPFLTKVTVLGVNDAPQITGQQNISINEDTSLTMMLNHFQVADVDSSILTLTVMAGDNYGLNGMEINPVQNYHGLLTVPVTISDSEGAMDNFSAQVSVISVNDAPNAVGDSATVVQGQSVDIQVLNNDSDVDSTLLSVVSVDYDGTGTVTISGSKLVYQSSEDFSGQEQFSYQVEDDEGGTDEATVSVEVTAAPTEPTTPPDPTSPTSPSTGSEGGSSGAFYGTLLLLVLVFKRRVRLFRG